MARLRPGKKALEQPAAARGRLAGFGTAASEPGSFDWGQAEPVLLAGVVVGITRLGGLASFGVTRDGGAGTITLFLEGERSTEYIKPGEDLDSKLAQAIDYLDSLR